VLLVGLALATPLTRFHWPEVQAALWLMRMNDATRRALPMSSHEAAIRFGHAVRRATPDPGGFLQRGVRPEYGILVPPAFGHRFTYTARRPVPANNLGPYLDLEKYRLATRFYQSRNSIEALRLLDRLSVRYVVTFARGARIVTFADHLHLRIDSAGVDSRSTGRLRLIAPAEPSPLTTPTDRGNVKIEWGVPFKLFERVEGALLMVEAKPGTEVIAAIRLEMSVGRSVVYRTVGIAGADGVARVRVPYSTRQTGLVATPGPWWVRVGDREIRYEVSEVDVRDGHEVSAADRSDS
jgi:asparagine N-glycosylation enzyme membrane subunit Stt3